VFFRAQLLREDIARLKRLASSPAAGDPLPGKPRHVLADPERAHRSCARRSALVDAVHARETGAGDSGQEARIISLDALHQARWNGSSAASRRRCEARRPALRCMAYFLSRAEIRHGRHDFDFMASE
jgi:hypothetical protein